MLNNKHDYKNKQIYIFDLSIYKHDYDLFILGKYSKFSEGAKNKILSYFNSNEKNYEYIKSFLNPLDYHDIYAENLGVNINIIKETHEVCSKPDLIKETLDEKKIKKS